MAEGYANRNRQLAAQQNAAVLSPQ
jgi:sodium/bile acid cotransporter 7